MPIVSQEFDPEHGASDCAVMVVGGGPAGISTWLHLNKYATGLARRSLVIEKDVFPRDKLCAGGLGFWTAELLEQLEIKLDIPSVLVTEVELRFEEELDYLHQPDWFRVVQRKYFDHALVKTALKRGLELRENEMYIGASRDGNRLIVNTNKNKYSVQVLIGADGAFSAVRRRMIPLHRPHFARTIQIFAGADPQKDTEFNEKRIALNFTPIAEGLQGYIWHVPCLREGAPSMAHGIVDFRIFPDQPRSDLKRIFSRELQARNIQQASCAWSSHPIHWFSNENVISRPNVILVGDAAGIEPAFGGGIHLSLAYGKIAAHAIIDAFDNDDFSFTDYKKRLQSHMLGKHLDESTFLALKMYGNKMSPLNLIHEFFTQKEEFKNLLSLLLFRD